MKKLNDMSDREILIWMMGEVRCIRGILTNHLHHHELQDNRRWKLYIGLLVVGGGIIAALLA
jgi:hypothetical protein